VIDEIVTDAVEIVLVVVEVALVTDEIGTEAVEIVPMAAVAATLAAGTWLFRLGV
jgi:hypothetical protein